MSHVHIVRVPHYLASPGMHHGVRSVIVLVLLMNNEAFHRQHTEDDFCTTASSITRIANKVNTVLIAYGSCLPTQSTNPPLHNTLRSTPFTHSSRALTCWNTAVVVVVVCHVTGTKRSPDPERDSQIIHDSSKISKGVPPTAPSHGRNKCVCCR